MLLAAQVASCGSGSHSSTENGNDQPSGIPPIAEATSQENLDPSFQLSLKKSNFNKFQDQYFLQIDINSDAIELLGGAPVQFELRNASWGDENLADFCSAINNLDNQTGEAIFQNIECSFELTNGAPDVVSHQFSLEHVPYESAEIAVSAHMPDAYTSSNSTLTANISHEPIGSTDLESASDVISELERLIAIGGGETSAKIELNYYRSQIEEMRLSENVWACETMGSFTVLRDDSSFSAGERERSYDRCMFDNYIFTGSYLTGWTQASSHFHITDADLNFGDQEFIAVSGNAGKQNWTDIVEGKDVRYLRRWVDGNIEYTSATGVYSNIYDFESVCEIVDFIPDEETIEIEESNGQRSTVQLMTSTYKTPSVFLDNQIVEVNQDATLMNRGSLTATIDNDNFLRVMATNGEYPTIVIESVSAGNSAVWTIPWQSRLAFTCAK